MSRWRILNLILILVAVAGMFVFSGRSWEPVNNDAAGWHPATQDSAISVMEKTFADLPGWVASLAMLLTLFMFGAANLFLFPARVRKMQTELTISWKRTFHIMLAGLAFGLLLVLTAMTASFSRTTFPLTVISGLSLFLLCLWGYLSLAYSLGHLLLQKADWRLSPFAALAFGLLILHSLALVPFAGFVFGLLGAGAGLGIVITTRFGSMQPWDLNLLLEERKE
jgi:hypothetical protein